MCSALHGFSALARLLGCQDHPGILYPVTTGTAMSYLRRTVEVIDEFEAVSQP